MEVDSLFPLGVVMIVVAGALAVIVGWLVNRYTLSGSFLWTGLLFGAGAFLVSMMLQNILVLPVAILIHGTEGLLQGLTPLSGWEATYYGIAAGIAQEAIKLAAINSYGKRQGLFPAAISVGAGFALFEIVFIGVSVFATQVAFGALLVPIWERFSAILFHIGTAILLGYGLKVGRTLYYFIVTVILHGIVDSAAGFLHLFEVENVIVFESVLFVAGVVLIWYTLRMIKNHVKEV